MALAGSANQENLDRLASRKKEKDEHAYVIEDIKKSVQSWAKISIGDEEIVTLSSGLSHIKTPISLECQRNVSPDECIQSLHPTAALGQLPRDILPLNRLYKGNKKRGHFGAPIGIRQNEQTFHYWVNIRSLQIDKDGQALLPVGGGLTVDSQLEEEWDEILLKVSSTLSSLGLSLDEVSA